MKDRIGGRLRRFRKDPRNWFYLISALGILLYFPLSFRFGGELYVWLVQENAPEIRFIDYFSHFERAADPTHLFEHVSWDGLGSYAAVFPPLAYGMYYVLYRLTFIRSGMTENMKGEVIPGALPVFTIYLIFNAVLFFCAIQMNGQRRKGKDLLLFTLLILSAVFAGSGYMLGNSAMLVLALLMMALELIENPDMFRREAGLLLLAVCVGMKIYPAVFGLVLLKKKRYRELLRFIFYSLVLLLAPFTFFGGLVGFRAWIGNLTGSLQSMNFYGKPQYLKGVFYTLIRALTGRGEMGWSSALTYMVCLLWAWLAWRSKSRWRTQFFLTCIMVFFPSSAYRYTLAYFSIPLVSLLKEEPETALQNRWAKGLFALFGLLYTIPVWWLLVMPLGRRFRVHTLTSVEIYLYLVGYLLVAVTMIVEIRSVNNFIKLPRRDGGLVYRKVE